MNLDIERILKDMVNAITDATEENIDDLGTYAKQILENQKESLKELGEARLKGEIDDEIFAQELEKEKKVTEAELLTLQIMAKSTVQKAVNAAIKVFKNAVKILL